MQMFPVEILIYFLNDLNYFVFHLPNSICSLNSLFSLVSGTCPCIEFCASDF